MKLVKDENLNNEQARMMELKNLLLLPEVKKQETVARNFRIEIGNMENLKKLTALARERGRRLTQDDVLNTILREWFLENEIM